MQKVKPVTKWVDKTKMSKTNTEDVRKDIIKELNTKIGILEKKIAEEVVKFDVKIVEEVVKLDQKIKDIKK
jgi:hypothetical protein